MTRRIYTDDDSRHARGLLSRMDVELTEDSSRADLIWLRWGHRAVMPLMRPWQAINHLPDEEALVTKGRLARLLRDHDAVRSSGEPALASFFPETYRLYDPAERDAFFARAREEADPLWVLKPTRLAMGEGIRVLDRLDALERVCYAKDPFHKSMLADLLACGLDPRLTYVIQRYLQRVLLLEGRKSELRVYWLLASLDPLLVLMHREGTVRLTTLPFELGSYDNPLIHITNVDQQRSHPGYDPAVRLKWTFAELEAHLRAEGEIEDETFLEARLRPRLRECLAFAVRAALGPLRAAPLPGHGFALYGADFMLDDRLDPWLTEVQKSPCLKHEDQVKRQVIPGVFREAIQIALQVRARKVAGASLRGLPLGGFEVVIDDRDSAT